MSPDARMPSRQRFAKLQDRPVRTENACSVGIQVLTKARAARLRHDALFQITLYESQRGRVSEGIGLNSDEPSPTLAAAENNRSAWPRKPVNYRLGMRKTPDVANCENMGAPLAVNLLVDLGEDGCKKC